jgi:ubiquinone/menaquinone biosynthesis C-methylase UbiE
MPELRTGALELLGPSAVGLRRLSARLSFPPGGETLYRSVLRQAGVAAESEFLIVPSGRGRAARFIAETTGSAGTGVDPDAQMVSVATERAKATGLGSRLHFEQAPLHDLPYQDAVFDMVLGEIEVAAAAEPESVLRELVRVARPGGTLVLIQLVWVRPPDDDRREELVERLGVRPLMVVEWKQLLKEAGVVDVQVEDWSDLAGSPRRMPLLGGLSELFSVRGKLWLLPRAWHRWGWRGVWATFSRESDLRQLLDQDRVLGVVVIRGLIEGVNGEGDRAERDE